jgi:alpha/beta superfamily hydrolase
MRKVFYVLVSILLILFGVEFVFFNFVRRITRLPQTKETIDPNSLLLKANDVSFKSSDGVLLKGWLIQGKPECPVLIIAHDYGSSRSRVLLNLENLITSLNKKGYYIFLFDFRGHGMSAGASSLGMREHLDLKGAFQAVLKYKQIEKRIGVLGIGMGAIASAEACPDVDEVKYVMFDRIYTDIAKRHAAAILEDLPFLKILTEPLFDQVLAMNMQVALREHSIHLNLEKRMPRLYPRPFFFFETNPPENTTVKLYEAAREPKELIQLGETATDDLTGDVRERYKIELEKKIQKYLPLVLKGTTLELSR